MFFEGNIKNLCWHTYKIIFQIETNCLIAFAKVFSISILIKQWLLAGEFGEFEYSPKRPFSEICETRQTRHIRQDVLRVLARLADIRQTVLRGLARLTNIRQAVLRGLARLAKGEFGKFYANLASLANLVSVG